MKNILLVTVGLILLMSCTQSNDKKAPSQTKDSTETKKPDSVNTQNKSAVFEIDSLKLDSKSVKELNDLAKFIAGIDVDNDSKFSKLSQTNIWKSYAKQANVSWKSFFDKNEAARVWGTKELNENRAECSKLLYPFSGPDVLFPEIFFPQTKEVFMIGLEPVGSIPQFKGSEKSNQLDTIFEKYKRAINEVIKFSFFMTKKMKVELTNQDIDGTTPIIMLFLVREGKELLKIEPIVVEKEGLVVVKENFNEIKRAKNKGVRFYYNDKGSKEVRQITYISTNLADGTLSVNKDLLAFFDKIDGKVCSYVKSASYLMHKSAFSTIRNTLLNKSIFHLQDDSGIPYKFIDQKKWDVQLYGTYEKPIQLFAKCQEEDLAQAFKGKNVKKLNFRIGYAGKSNLLLAKKKK